MFFYFSGTHRDIDVRITPGESIKITSDQLPLLLLPVKLPSSLTLLREVCMSAPCVTVIGRNNHIYVGLWDGDRVSVIGPTGETQHFLTAQSFINGMDIHDDKIIISTKDQVYVYDVTSGELIHSWAYTDVSGFISSNLAVVGDEVVITDRGNKRLSVYTLTGQLVRHIPCQQMSDYVVSLCCADNNSVILSDRYTNKVHRISITSGHIIWTSSHVKRPLGVTCYNNQYVLVSSRGENVMIWILDIKTGELSCT